MPKDETCCSFFSSFFPLVCLCAIWNVIHWLKVSDEEVVTSHISTNNPDFQFYSVPLHWIRKKMRNRKNSRRAVMWLRASNRFFWLSFVVWFRIILHSVRKCRSNKISARYLSNNKTTFINFRLGYFECCWNWFGPKERQMTLLHSLCELHLWKAHQNYGYMGRPSTQLFACCLCEQQ